MNAIRSRIYALIVDSIVGHTDLYVSISDDDLVGEIDRMKFDQGESAICIQK
jgi:hypothetical protein